MTTGNGKATRPRNNASCPPSSHEVPKPGSEELADRGDVLGLLAWLRSRSVLRLPPSAMDNLAKAIRSLERTDVDALVETTFAEVIGLTTTLFIRCQMHVERRLAEADSYGGTPTHMPADLVDEDWLGRIERIARFFMQITETRERVRHLARLNKNARDSNSNFRWLDNRSPMDEDPGPARNGQGVPGNGRFNCPESRIEFP